MIKKILLNFVLPIIFFIGLTILISHKVLPNTGAIAHNDGTYYFNIEGKQDYRKSIYTDDYFGKDLSSNIFLRQIKSNIIYGLVKIGIPHNYVSYIITFGLAFICSLIYYFIFFNISGNRLFGYFAGIFVIFNNFTIESIAFGGYFYYFLGLIGIGLLINILYNIYIKNKVELIDLIYISLISGLIILPIHLVIFFFILMLFIIFFYKVINNYYLLFWIFILILMLHSYWIVPFLINIFHTTSEAIYGGTADGVLKGYAKNANYLNTISFRQYFNNISFRIFPYNIVFLYYIGLVLFVIFIFLRKKTFGKKEYKLIIFLILLYLLFFNISLGPKSLLTGEIYVYLWSNFGFFHFFRSFTRFILPIIPILLLIYSLFIKNNGFKKIYFFLIILAMIFANLPLISGNLNGIIPAINIPKDYAKINKIILKNDRFLSFPNISYETYKWSISNSELMRQDYYLKEYLFDSSVIYNRASLRLDTKNSTFKQIFKNNLDVIKDNNINYIIIHKDYINIFNGKLIPYNRYTAFLDKQTGVEKIEDNEFFTLYKIKDSHPKIFVDNSDIEFTQISSVKYKIKIRNLDKDNLYFLNNFSNKWKLYSLENNGTNKYSYSDIIYLFKKDYFGNTHEKYNEYANKWNINKEDISKYFPKKSYSINLDGSINVNLILYYIPQVYYYIGKIISGFTIILLIIFFLFTFYKNKNEK